jgi:hypothetical protein
MAGYESRGKLIMDYKNFIDCKNLYQLDYYGETIRVFKGLKLYEQGCPNLSVISESSLSHILDLMQKQTFAIISAHLAMFDRKENILRNRKLRAIFNNAKMGVHSLIGHWRECQLKGTDNNPIKYQDCPENKLVDVIERSYLVIKPNNMIYDDFENLIRDAMTIDGEVQNGVIIKNAKGDYVVMDKQGVKFKIGNNIKLNKIAQAYSQHIKKQNVPFMFEGLEVPNGSIMSYQIWNNKEQNFRYDKVD